MGSAIDLALSVAVALAPQDHPPPPTADIIVIGKPIAPDAPPLDTISRDDIDTLAARTIGDVIAAAKRRVAGGSAPVIVNGRRLGDIADISALPPEAIERVEILPPSAGARRGLGSATPIVNVVLKQHFRSLSASVEAATATGGGGDDARVALTGAALDGERRGNASLSASRQAALRYRDRFDAATLVASGDAPDPAASLRPSAAALSLLAGKALAVGMKQLSLSANGTINRNAQRLGGSRGTQRNGSADAGLSATLSGPAGKQFWTVIANARVSRSSGETRGDDAARFASGSRATSADLAATLSGPLMRLPAGTATYSVNTAFAGSRLAQSLDGAPPTIDTRGSANSQLGLELPLHRSGESGSLLGDIVLRGQAQASRTTGTDALVGHEQALSWAPRAWFNLEWSNTYRSLGGSRSPGIVTVQPDVLLFDPVAGQSVRVRQIGGGNPAPMVSSQRRSSVRASINRRMRDTDLVASFVYAKDRIADPVFTSSPSVLIERAFPNRFVRDAAGRLVEIDTRPLNAYRQDSDTLTVAVTVTGRAGRRARDGGLGDGKSIRWIVNLNYATRLVEQFRLTAASPVLDLRSARIGTGGGIGGGGSRNTLDAQASIGNAFFAGQLRVDWRSDTMLLGEGTDANGVYRQPLRIAVDADVGLGSRRAAPGGIGKLRLGLAIDNLLDARPRVRFPDRPTPFALLPANLDPLGRTIRLTLRSALD